MSSMKQPQGENTALADVDVCLAHKRLNKQAKQDEGEQDNSVG